MIYSSTLISPIGKLKIFTDEHALLHIKLPGSVTKTSPSSYQSHSGNHALLYRAQKQLKEYFQGKRRIFDLLLCPQGTPFQQSVWSIMQEIPFGETKTYGEIAAALGNSNKARAVGGAANKNPLPIVIPCHRVIGSSGSLTGFAGGLETKKYLLNLEQT